MPTRQYKPTSAGRRGMSVADFSEITKSTPERSLLERAARNLPTVKVLRAEGANVYDILRHPHLVVTRAAVDALRGRIVP